MFPNPTPMYEPNQAPNSQNQAPHSQNGVGYGLTQMAGYNPAFVPGMFYIGGQLPLDRKCKTAADRIEGDFSIIKRKIYRYPANLYNLLKENRYFLPSAVAIGPYYCQLPYLQKAQEIKRAATHLFCKALGRLPNDILQSTLPVAVEARSCYDAGDVDMNVVSGIPDTDFAAMMLCDGCFLLQFIMWKTNGGDSALKSWFVSKQACILKDIFMMENQIPWTVLKALMDLKPGPINKFISQAGSSFQARVDSGKQLDEVDIESRISSYTPAHLLGLLWYYQSGSDSNNSNNEPPVPDQTQEVKSVAQSSSSSAVELAEIGIKVVPSNTTLFNDIGVSKGLIFGKLSLPPMVLNDQTACWLVNLITLEACWAITGTKDEYTITSYVLLLAMLMNRKEDVHELQVKRILHGDLGDERTLAYFKILAELIHHPAQHSLLKDLDAYKYDRRVRSAVHKFIYKNFKTIVMVCSIIGALVGFFKTLLSMKQNQH
ncbi:unnamed protein product [Urochloa humidicola]